MNLLSTANKYIGTKEVAGSVHNPAIVKMYSEVGFPGVKDDETAWCAAFVGFILKKAGMPYMKSLSARSYLKYGKKLTEPKEGAIAVFWRGKPDGWQGHVGFVTKWDHKYIWVLGGNQNNEVNETKMERSKLLGLRWPIEAPQKPQKPDARVIGTSTKLSVFQGIRRSITVLGTGIAGIFSLDTFGMGVDMATQLKAFMTEYWIFIFLGGLAFTWLLLKWNEWKHIVDFQEGRYIPSKMAEEKENVDVPTKPL